MSKPIAKLFGVSAPTITETPAATPAQPEQASGVVKEDTTSTSEQATKRRTRNAIRRSYLTDTTTQTSTSSTGSGVSLS